MSQTTTPGGAVAAGRTGSELAALLFHPALVAFEAGGEEVDEGDSFRLTDSEGRTQVFEFDPGFWSGIGYFLFGRAALYFSFYWGGRSLRGYYNGH